MSYRSQNNYGFIRFVRREQSFRLFNMGGSRPTLLPLTSLRFFAALAVVIFHYDGKHSIFPAGLAEFGYEAVTFFFILSGFVLTYAHATTARELNVTARQFMAARLIRILPAYMLALAIAAPFFVHGTLKDGDLTAFLGGAVLVPIMAQAWLPAFALAWNAPAWSLSNEMFFYSLYPWLWGALGRRPWLAMIALAFALIIGVEVIRYVLSGFASPIWHNFRAYFPLFNLPQFLLGVALAMTYLFGRSMSPRAHSAIFISAIILLIGIIVMKPKASWLANTIVLSLVFGSIVFGAARSRDVLSRVLSSKPMIALGEASYALYILHVPLWLLWHRLNKVYLQTETPLLLDFALYSMLVVSASLLVSKLVETPVRGVFRRTAATSRVAV